MLIEARAVELSNGSEVAAHAKEVLARRAQFWAAAAPPPVLVTIAPLIAPAKPAAPPPAPLVIDDDTYAEMLKRWSIDDRPPGKTVCRIVAHHFGITYAELRGASRRQVFVRPRHVAMYICIRALGYSFPQTARAVGRSDHTTVLIAVRRIAARMAVNPAFAAEVAELISACGALR